MKYKSRLAERVTEDDKKITVKDFPEKPKDWDDNESMEKYLDKKYKKESVREGGSKNFAHDTPHIHDIPMPKTPGHTPGPGNPPQGSGKSEIRVKI